MKSKKAGAKPTKKAAPKKKAGKKAPLKRGIPVTGNKLNQGSKSLYSDDILPRVEELAAKGLQNKEIATALGISERTFYEWSDKHEHFSHAIKKYRGVADILVENALFKTAVGFEYEEVKNTFMVVDKELVPIVETTRKFQPGKVAAQDFYLTNRRSERWKRKVETVHTLGAEMENIEFSIKRREPKQNSDEQRQ